MDTHRIQRQNIMNNKYALEKVEAELNFSGILYNNTHYYTNEQISEFFNVSVRTIERIIEQHREELEQNNYHILSGKYLKEFRKKAIFPDGNTIDYQTRNLSLSTVRTILNFAMLLTDSPVAKVIRSRILDIVVDTFAQKTNGNVKFINQRDTNYLMSSFDEKKAREEFTDSIKKYVDGNNFKYAKLTDHVYKAVFKENSREYKRILNLNKKDNARETMYSEVLIVIASFEKGIAYELKKFHLENDRNATEEEAKRIIDSFASHPSQEPHLNNARHRMASRDLGFRDAVHINLKEYITPLSSEEFESFIGEKSKALEEQIAIHKDIFERLRDK